MFDLVKFMKAVEAYLLDRYSATLVHWTSTGRNVSVEVHDEYHNVIKWEMEFSLDWTMVTMQSVETDCVCFVSARAWVVGAVMLS